MQRRNSLGGGYSSVAKLKTELAVQAVLGAHYEYPEPLERLSYALEAHPGYEVFACAVCSRATMRARNVLGTPITCGMQGCDRDRGKEHASAADMPSEITSDPSTGSGQDMAPQLDEPKEQLA